MLFLASPSYHPIPNVGRVTPATALFRSRGSGELYSSSNTRVGWSGAVLFFPDADARQPRCEGHAARQPSAEPWGR
eukprot:2019017-Rhodomonas_salina.1